MSQRHPSRRGCSVVRAVSISLAALLLCAGAGAVQAQAATPEPPPSASGGPVPTPPPAAIAPTPPPGGSAPSAPPSSSSGAAASPPAEAAPPAQSPDSSPAAASGPPLGAAAYSDPPVVAPAPVPVAPAPAANGAWAPPAPVPVAPAAAAALQPSAAPREPDGLAAVESDGEVRAPRAQGPHCLLGRLCFGPVLTLGILDVFGIGAQARTDYWGVAFDYQFLKFTTQDIPVSLSLLTVEGRLYPFAGAFFLAGGLAWQHANLSRHVSYAGGGGVPGFEADLAGKINIPVLKLGLGVMGRSGFVFGIDLAFGIQLGGNTVELNSTLPRVDEVVAAEKKIRDRADKFVRAIPFLLQLNLIRIGFLF